MCLRKNSISTGLLVYSGTNRNYTEISFMEEELNEEVHAPGILFHDPF